MPDAGTLEDGKDKEGSLLSKKSEVYSIRRFCFTLYASVYFYELNARCRACSLNLLEPTYKPRASDYIEKMQEMIKITIGVLILLLGIPIGNFLAKITKEELKSGQKEFKLIVIISLIGGFFGLIFFLYSNCNKQRFIEKMIFIIH